MKPLAAYDVYLKSRRGTIKRTTHVSKRSVKLAGDTARSAVERALREPVEVIDVVPLRVTAKASTTTGRGRRPVTRTTLIYKQTRRPKARPSVKLSRKGKLLPFTKPEPTTPYSASSVRLSERVKPRSSTCERKACQDRGFCSHVGRPEGRDLHLYRVRLTYQRTQTKRGVWAIDEEAAKQFCKANLKQQNMKGARILEVARVPHDRPFHNYTSK